jgi:signal transduction histidine kinase
MPEAEALPMDPSRTRVLLVEDELSDALAVERSLRGGASADERFDLERATTLADGIVRLQRAPVDVLLLDLGLPDSDGPATVASLRRSDTAVPVVVLTGNDDPALAARAFEAGADDYFVKDDLRAGRLRRTLRHAIERRRANLPDAELRSAPGPDEQRYLLHDLKNLHMSILGNARILQQEVREHGFLRQRVDALLGATRSAAELLRKLGAGAESAMETQAIFDLSALASAVEPLLRSVLSEGVVLQLDLASDSAAVAASPDLIRRVLLELVINAVEAIGAGKGRIEVRTGHALLAKAELAELVASAPPRPGPHAWIEVRDDGCGFDPARLSQLFERGYSTKGAGRGSGLGQVLDILGRHRAALRIRSRPSGGAAFRILLPSPE